MSLRFIGKTLLATTLLSSSLIAFAENGEVLCPPASFIKNLWTDINTVSVHYGRWSERVFFASAEDPTFDQGSKLWWNVHSITDRVRDFNTAFTMGQNNAKNVYQGRNKYAQKSTDRYFCSYQDNTGNASVWAWGYKNEDGARKDINQFLSIK